MVQPDTIKYGEIELIKEESKAINKKAKEAVQLALETTAMLTWNAGRYDVGGKHNEEIATSLLKELYGDRALNYRYALQRKGLWVTPNEELEKIPNVPFLKGFITLCMTSISGILRWMLNDNVGDPGQKSKELCRSIFRWSPEPTHRRSFA